MRIIDCVQGSPEWHAARAGIPTASRFECILTKTGKLSAQADKYMTELLAELAVPGHGTDSQVSEWMARGTALESEAVRDYEWRQEVTTTKVGFVLHDSLPVGASPDRLIGDEGGMEIKCPATHTHIGYLLGRDEAAYKPQIQGNLWVTGRRWWDFYSYHPDLPAAIVRFERDEAYIEALEAEILAFLERLDRAKEALAARGVELLTTDEIRERMLASERARTVPVQDVKPIPSATWDSVADVF